MKIYDLLTPAHTTDTTDTVYYMSDVIAVLGVPQRSQFERWLRGKPLLIVNDRGALYKNELLKFLKQLEKGR